ncbi:MAG TPA: hypothetical protein VI160_05160, partial [Gemmatimonadales bacterium]
GRIEVLYPAAPTDDPSVARGSYDVPISLDPDEPVGQGTILAAVSTDPIWFYEFARNGAWDPDALAPSWRGGDATGALTDIVQRMLGDGSFNYDVVSLTTVAPPAIPVAAAAPAPEAPPASVIASPCIGCTVIGTQIITDDRGFGFVRLPRRHFRREVPVRPDSGFRTFAVAPLVIPLHPRAASSASGDTARRRPVRSAPAAPAVVTLAGAPPEARSALVLRYVRPARDIPAAAPVPATPPAAAVPSSRRTTVAAPIVIRTAPAAPAVTPAVTFFAPVNATPRRSVAPASAPAAAPAPAPPAVAPRPATGTIAAPIVIRRRTTDH